MILNPEQREAVSADGHLSVIAVPGAGKTAMLVAKCQRILSEDPCARIGLVVYNEAAAREMVERIRQSGTDGRRIQAGTYHALALWQLRREGRAINLVTGAKLWDLKFRAWEMAGRPGSLDELDGLIDHYKTDRDSFLNPERFAQQHAHEEGYYVYRAYQDLLARYRVCDFTDLLIHCVQGMNEGSVEALAVTHLMLDEFQDIDPVQLLWVMLTHRSRACVVTSVGDDDQTIYSFRNALGFKGFQAFQHHFGAPQIELSTNYRSRQEILWAARVVIEANIERVPKEYRAFRGNGGRVHLRERKAVEEEFAAIVEWEREQGYGTRVVLARTNKVLDAVEEALQLAGVEYVRVGGARFWDHGTARLLLDTVSAVRHPDPVLVSQLLRRSGVSDGEVAHLADQTQGFTTVSGDRETLPEKKLAIIRQFFQENHGKLESGDPSVNQVIAAAARFLDRVIAWPEKPTRSLSQGVLAAAATALGRWKGPWQQRRKLAETRPQPTSGILQLRTEHGSKGLEFDTVWMVGMGADIVPPQQSVATDWEEERRLFFVAMTRAKDELHISFSGNPCEFVAQLKDAMEAPAQIEEV